MDDQAIPVVFPAFLIAVPRPGIDLPAFMNRAGLPDIKSKVERVPDLGHAGVLLIRGKDGLTRYYEYGRYDTAALGLVRRQRIPDLKGKKGSKLEADLAPLLAAISRSAGQGGLVKGVMIPISGKFADAVAYADKRLAENGVASRKPYSLLNNSCIDFARDVVVAAGVDMPYNLDPRPLAYMETLRGEYSKVMYDPRTKEVSFK